MDKSPRKDTPLEIFLAGLGICALTGMFVWAVLGMFEVIR